MAAIRTANICNVKTTTSQPGLSSRKEEGAIGVPLIDEFNEIVVPPDDARLMHFELHHMVESALKIFEEIAKESR